MPTYTSVASGNWSNSATWTPVGVPGLTDLVRIAVGHTVTLDGTYIIGNETAVAGAWTNADLVVNGTLKYSRATNASLTVRGVSYFSPTGTLDMGTAGDEIPGTITANLLINGSLASPSPGKHRLVFDMGARFFSRSTFNRKRKVKLTAISTSGTPTATFDSVRDWQVGDLIRFHPATNVSTVGLYEEMTIGSIAGNTVTFTTNFSQTRAIGCSAANVTSNIKIMPANGGANGANVIYRFSNTTAVGALNLRDLVFENTGVSDGVMGSNNATGFNSAPWSWCTFGVDAVSTPNGNQVAGISSCVINSINGLATARTQLSLNGTVQNSFPVDDFAIVDMTTSNYALYVASSMQVDINNLLTIRCGGAFVTGFSFGTNGGTIRNSSFTGSSAAQNLINLGAGSGLLFEDCDAAGAGALIAAASHGKSVFRRCNFIFPIGLQSFVTNPYQFGVGGICDILFDECYPAPTQAPGNQTTTGEQSFMTFANAAGDPTRQFIYSKFGLVDRENSIFRTAAPSIETVPNNATKPLQLSFQIAAPTGKVVAITGFWRKSNALIAATARLFGLNATTVTTTMPADLNVWTPFSLSAMQTTGVDAYLNVRIDVTGTAGSFYLDDLSAFSPDPVSTGDFKIFVDGKSVPFILSSAVSAADVWNAPISANSTPGTKGGELNDTETFANLASVK